MLIEFFSTCLLIATACSVTVGTILFTVVERVFVVAGVAIFVELEVILVPADKATLVPIVKAALTPISTFSATCAGTPASCTAEVVREVCPFRVAGLDKTPQVVMDELVVPLHALVAIGCDFRGQLFRI